MKEKVVGVVICDVENKNEVREEPVGIFPEKFMKLERFFGDMKSNIDLFEEVGIDEDQYTDKYKQILFSARHNFGYIHSLLPIIPQRARNRGATWFV